VKTTMLVPALFGLALMAAPPAKPTPYKPDPRQWKLQVKGIHGGWTTDSELEVLVKVVDPLDPDPPKDEEPRWIEDPDMASDDAETSPSPQRDPERWRHRTLTYWWNGQKARTTIEVGVTTRLALKLAQGENRLELWQPDSNRRLVRSLWGTSTRDRLTIHLVDTEAKDRWWGGGLQVIEPDHTESINYEPTPSGGRNHGDRYVHPTPIPGTYTVRWFDPESGVDGYEYGGYGWGDKRPRKLKATIVLDAGTENERRWTFEKLVMPGTRRVTLGSFDIED